MEEQKEEQIIEEPVGQNVGGFGSSDFHEVPKRNNGWLKRAGLLVVIFIAGLALGVGGFFAWQYLVPSKFFQIQKPAGEQSAQCPNVCQKDEAILHFQSIFVEKVLGAREEVSANDRLLLEQAVTDIHDDEFLSAWHELLASTTEEVAQQKVLLLLRLFSEKIR